MLRRYRKVISRIACAWLVCIATARAQTGTPASAPGTRGDTDSVHVIVIRDLAGIPLRNAAVQLGDRIKRTNFDGIVIVEQFPGLRYPLKLQVRAPGFRQVTTLIDPTRQRIEVFLTPHSHSPTAGTKVVSVSELSPEVRAEAARLCEAALAAVEKGDLPAAHVLLRQAHEKTPSSTGIHQGLALIALHQGRVDDAARWLEEALELNPSSSRLIGDLGTVRFFQERRQESYRLLSRAVERGYDRTGTHYRLGLLAFGEGRWKEASKEFKRTSADRFPYRDLFLSQALRRLGKTREAAQAFLRFLARNPVSVFITRWTGPVVGRSRDRR
jgi:Tfp pilus assembly protein PilF